MNWKKLELYRVWKENKKICRTEGPNRLHMRHVFYCDRIPSTLLNPLILTKGCFKNVHEHTCTYCQSVSFSFNKNWCLCFGAFTFGLALKRRKAKKEDMGAIKSKNLEDMKALVGKFRASLYSTAQDTGWSSHISAMSPSPHSPLAEIRTLQAWAAHLFFLSFIHWLTSFNPLFLYLSSE